MRQFKLSEEKRIQILTQHLVQMSYLELTETGLKKSIMDATAIVRQYLLDEGIHDYYKQGQGEDYKKIIKAHIITDDNILETKASLYRPKTKMGDPRIWIYNLNKFVFPGDIISIVAKDGELYVFNLTRSKIDTVINRKKGPLFEFVKNYETGEKIISTELLNKLKAIASRGLIKSIVRGDTGVGRTLETCLGIEMNSSKNPDYKGIELKAGRVSANTRQTLFAQVPDWGKSQFSSSAEILDNFGYDRDGIKKLYCTVSSLRRNSQGLILKLDEELKELLENSEKREIGDFVVWPMDLLTLRLKEKHKETFWIKAETVIKDGHEYFHYKSVIHTKSPIISQFVPLIEQGDITVDHLIKRNLNGRVSEKGPLFKIQSKSLKLLFPDPSKYQLTD